MQLANVVLSLLFMVTTTSPGNDPIRKGVLNHALALYIDALKPDFASIPTDRKVELDKITDFIQQKVNAGQPVQLTYICTHNSRRSHFGQLWAAAAAVYYEVPDVNTFSGGTEVSAFNERAAAACSRAGFVAKKTSETANARYEVSYATGINPLDVFSKTYNDAPNPQRDFCAIMTCSQADQACPIVQGAAARVATPYDDPKAFDGRPEETAKYDERCRQIATETCYVFSAVKKKA